MNQPLRRKRIHDRFLQNDTYRSSQLEKELTEETCIQLDALAQEDHTYTATREESITVNIRRQLANVKTTRKQSQHFVRRKMQTLPAVKSSVLTYQRLSVSHSDLNRNMRSIANNFNMHIH